MLRSKGEHPRKTVAQMIAEMLRKTGLYLIILGGVVGISTGEASKAVQAMGIGLLSLIAGFILEEMRRAPSESDHLSK
jgi:hypothetical protein